MWIEIFRTGNFVDSNGKAFDCDETTLADIERTYNIASERGYSAPIVKGHPSSDAPAYGWVERLARRGNKLVAKLRDVSSDIIDEVRAGKYRWVSVSLTPELLLRHVGLLGAVHPAVDGLAPVEFEQANDDITFTYDFAFQDDEQTVNSLISINEHLKKTVSELQTKLKTIEYREFVDNFFERNNFLLKNDAIKEQLIDLLVRCDTSINQDCEHKFNAGLEIIKILSQIKPSAYFSNLNLPQISNNYTQFSGKNVEPTRLELHRRAVEMTMENPSINYQQAINILQGESNV